jgi:hypothetical protein
MSITQSEAWYSVQKQLGYSNTPDDVEDIVAIKTFLDRYLGAQDALLIATYIGTGVAYSTFSVTDRRESTEETVQRSAKELNAEDKKRNYGTKTSLGRTVQDAYDNAEEVIDPKYFSLLVKWGEAKKKAGDKSLEDNSQQDADAFFAQVQNAITPSPTTSIGIGLVLGSILAGYLLVRYVAKKAVSED